LPRFEGAAARFAALPRPQQRDVPSELEALADKTARTLVTSFEQVLRRMASELWPEVIPTSTATAVNR